MPRAHDVYDDEEVQRMARSQVSQLMTVTSAAVAVTLLGLTLGATGRISVAALGAGLVVIWVSVAAWTAWRLRSLRRRVWCVRLTDDGVEGYDYARRKLTLDWDDVRRIDLTDHGLVVVGTGPCLFEVPSAFNDFADLSHRLVRDAERRSVPLYVDGRPWQQLDVYHLFPMLSDEPFDPRPGSAV